MFFFFNDTATTEIYTLSLHDALPIYRGLDDLVIDGSARRHRTAAALRRAGFGSLAFSIPLGFSTGRPLSPLRRAISVRWAATVCSKTATLLSNSKIGRAHV